MVSVVEIHNRDEFYIHYHSPASLDSHQGDQDSITTLHTIFHRDTRSSSLPSLVSQDTSNPSLVSQNTSNPSPVSQDTSLVSQAVSYTHLTLPTKRIV